MRMFLNDDDEWCFKNQKLNIFLKNEMMIKMSKTLMEPKQSFFRVNFKIYSPI